MVLKRFGRVVRSYGVFCLDADYLRQALHCLRCWLCCMFTFVGCTFCFRGKGKGVLIVLPSLQASTVCEGGWPRLVDGWVRGPVVAFSSTDYNKWVSRIAHSGGWMGVDGGMGVGVSNDMDGRMGQ